MTVFFARAHVTSEARCVGRNGAELQADRIRPQFRVIRKQREQIDASATEAFAGMRIVRAFSRQKRETARFATENNLMARQELYAWWWMRVIEMLWDVAYADGVLDPEEDLLIRKIAGLIAVTDRERVLARNRVMARLGINIL